VGVVTAPRRGFTTTVRLPLEAVLTDDGEPPCDPPDGCAVCSLFPRADEPFSAYLARLGDLYRMSPDGHELRWRAS
jgi:hypothetical protein